MDHPGLATGPVDRAAVEEAIGACYHLAGLRWPGRVVWVPSPVVGALAAPLAAHPLFNEDDVRKAKVDVWVDGVDQSVRGSVAGVLSGALHMRVVTHAMYGRWCWSLGGWGLDWPAYFSFLRQVCGLELPGDLWAREAALARAEAAAGWWWPHRRFVLVCERSTDLHLERAGPGGAPRLHNPDGPAIRWRDGWAVHALHGTRVPAPHA